MLYCSTKFDYVSRLPLLEGAVTMLTIGFGGRGGYSRLYDTPVTEELFSSFFNNLNVNHITGVNSLNSFLSIQVEITFSEAFMLESKPGNLRNTVRFRLYTDGLG